MKKDVLGIKIDDVSIDQAVVKVQSWLKKKGKYYIVTPNPEIIMMAQKDQQLKKILNNADLAIPDGVGLKLFTDIVMTTPGVDLMETLIKLSSEKGFTVGFLGGRDEVANKASECLLRKYPKLKITFASDGGIINENGDTVGQVLIPNTDLLFVAFGPPKQEKWIAKNINKIPVKVVMAVGGAFDYFSGKVPRAPEWIRQLGLEWLFRLVIQPWRLKRQLALIEYIWLILTRPKI